MPVNSRDVQFGAAIGFIVIVGIVAIYFGFSAKLVLALLAGLGILFCASLVDGYLRAAMLGTGAVLLLLVVYDLATSCDSACQQSRAEVARQRAMQLQIPTATASPATNTSEDCPGRLSPLETITTEEKVFNPKGCNYYYTAASSGVVIFKGPLGATRRVDLAAKAEPVPWVAYSVRTEGGTAVWQYVLCAAPKQHMERLDCY
jgi:hypothetical protein